MKIITDPHCTEYSKPGNPEAPTRVSGTIEKLHAQNTFSVTWESPGEIDEATILRAHSAELLQRLLLPDGYDEDTPAYPGIANFARRSAAAALSVLKAAQEGQLAFSVMRPPGHHATRNLAMGYCFLNSIAIAALEAQVRGYKRVAILDFDVHHGNGTEDIVLDHPGIAFASVHQCPEYPWTGNENRGANCFNFPMAAETPRAEYLAQLTAAMDKLKKSKPDLIAVSAGFDAHKHDPLSHQHLETEDYQWLGKSVRDFQIPVVSILEGGYSEHLPELVCAFLSGLEGK